MTAASAIDASHLPPSPPPTQPESPSQGPTLSPQEPPPKRHLQFYLDEVVPQDAVVLQAGNTLYRLSKFILRRKIKFFFDALSLPLGVNNMREGTCDQSPILVPGITEEPFDFVLSSMFGRYESAPSIQNLLSGLEYSLRWIIPDLRLYSIHHLNEHIKFGRVHAAIAICLARRHGVPRWIEPALRVLKDVPLSLWSLTPDIASHMTLDTYIIIARLRERLQTKRTILALRGPDVLHKSDCLDQKGCGMAWDLTWMAKIGRKLLHPEDVWRPALREIQHCAEAMEIPEMTRSCFDSTMLCLRTAAAWNFEEDAIRKAVELLMVPETNLDFSTSGDPMET